MSDEENKDLGTQGATDKVKGAANQVAGNIQKKAGQLTGDTSTEAKGAARETGGKVQSKVGNAEQTVDDKLKENNP